MLIAFFDAEGSIHHEFVPENQTVNGKVYEESIKGLIAGVHCVRPEFQESGSWYILHDNAPAPQALCPSFWRNEGSPFYPIHPTPLI
jgi:hypothetical protein